MLSRTLKILATIPQRPDGHPEGDVRTHTALVWAQVEEDELLQWVALFHDMGKIDTLCFNPKTGFATSYGHEKESIKYVDKYVNLLPMELQPECERIKTLILQHMRIKKLDEMRKSKVDKIKIILGKDFDRAVQFAHADDMRRLFDETNMLQRRLMITRFDNWTEQLCEKEK